jgi:hypothetical protein
LSLKAPFKIVVTLAGLSVSARNAHERSCRQRHRVVFIRSSARALQSIRSAHDKGKNLTLA